MTIDIVLTILSFALCAIRTISTFRARRLITIAWLLLAYFSFFLIPVSFEEDISWFRNFSAEYVRATRSDIHSGVMFSILFNFFFLIADHLVWRLLRRHSTRVTFRLPPFDSRIALASRILFAFWLLGSAWYFLDSRNMTYREYVEEGGHWSVVFFWASSPLITLMAMQRRWKLGLLLCLPFLYFGVHLEVRSFALLSLVPLLIVWLGQLVDDQAYRVQHRRLIRNGIVAGLLLVALSIGISHYKTGEFAFPDSSMPYGFIEAKTMADRAHERVGSNGLILYGVHYVNPFMRLFGIAQPQIDDTPVIIARLLDGVPVDWPVYFHYPALIWADAYLSFGWGGLWLAAFWAVVLGAWDWFAMRSAAMTALVLPYLAWHDYLLVRGATAVASVPLAYSFYLSIAVFLLALGPALFRSSALPFARVPTVLPERPSNLMG